MHTNINGLPLEPRQTATQTANKAGAERSHHSRAHIPTAAHADTLKLTDSAQRLQQSEKTNATAPAPDSNRIAQIKQAIANGSYQIDSGRIADRLLNIERSLAGLS